MAPEKIALDAEDFVLLLLESNERIFKKPIFYGITRLEKLIFLLKYETAFQGIGAFFPFKAHNFGPFSKDVYAAVDSLEGFGLIEVGDKTYAPAYAVSDEAELRNEISDDSEGDLATEKCFSLTENGRKVARIIRESINQEKPSDINDLDSIVRRYGGRPLNHLIRYVYRQYPKMTINSIHPEAKRINHNMAR